MLHILVIKELRPPQKYDHLRIMITSDLRPPQYKDHLNNKILIGNTKLTVSTSSCLRKNHLAVKTSLILFHCLNSEVLTALMCTVVPVLKNTLQTTPL